MIDDRSIRELRNLADSIQALRRSVDALSARMAPTPVRPLESEPAAGSKRDAEEIRRWLREQRGEKP